VKEKEGPNRTHRKAQTQARTHRGGREKKDFPRKGAQNGAPKAEKKTKKQNAENPVSKNLTPRKGGSERGENKRGTSIEKKRSNLALGGRREEIDQTLVFKPPA